jgi:aprataxin
MLQAKKHLLIIARRDGLDSIEDVGSQHLALLKHMHSLGETWARRYIDEDPTLVFRLGYHWVSDIHHICKTGTERFLIFMCSFPNTL